MDAPLVQRLWLNLLVALRLGERQRHGEAAVTTVCQLHAAAVRLGNLARERQTKACPIALGRIKRQQRIRRNSLAHAAAAIGHFNAQVACVLSHAQFDRVGGATGLVRILE